jgi:hypothetical protein
VRPSEKQVVIRVNDLNTDTKQAPGSLTQPAKVAFQGCTELCQIGVDYHGDFENTHPDTEPLVDISAGEVRSDTGELYRSWTKRYGTVDTPKTKAVYGRLGRLGKLELDGFTVNCKNDYATLTISSLVNEKDICDADSLLLTTVGVVENTDMKLSMAPASVQPNDGLPPYLQLDDFGRAPIICEVIEADIALKTSVQNLVVWAVNAEGIFVGNVPVKYEDGWAKFTLGKKSPSIYYLIQAE